MEAAQALADLTEISSQIEVAVRASQDGSVVASTVDDEERAKAVAGAALELLQEAGQVRRESGDGPTQLQAETPEGSVFVVRDEGHVVAAVTGAEPTAGLIFYDLKTCLRLVGEEPEEKPKVRRRTRKKESTDADT